MENHTKPTYMNVSFRKISVYFTTAVFIAIALRVVAPLLDLSGEIKLPVDAYCPCDIRHATCYWILYWHQALGTGVATLTHAAKDCLISALLLQTCAQLEILKNRLLSIADTCVEARNRAGPANCVEKLEHKLIGECAHDHESIFK